MPALTLSRHPPRVPSADGRSRDARLLRRVREELAAHVGGQPSATQRGLIERAAWLSLYVARLDAKAMEAGGMTEHDARQYLAWSNSLTRTLRQLGTHGAAERAPSLAAYLATRESSSPAAQRAGHAAATDAA